MPELPKNTVTQADLFLWYEMQEQLKKLKAGEMLLRKKIFDFYFADPKEGVNSYAMPDAYVLKGTYVINREVDPGGFEALRPTLEKANVSPDKLVVFKPSLVVKEYRTLTAEEQKMFDQCLIIKPGAPSLEIVKPAKG